MTAQLDRKEAKFCQILSGAQRVFLERGFAGASVEGIAREAGVSKPTIYSHFADKQELFVAVIHEEFSKQAERVWSASSTAHSLDEQLTAFGNEFLNAILTPKLQRLFRLVLAELDRFPEIGGVFYRATMAKGVEVLGACLAHYQEEGEVVVPDLALASHQFLELCRAGVYYPNVLKIRKTITPAERAEHVRQAVQAFLRIYGVRN